MKIMIVDDEVIIRTGLAMMIDWQELGLELAEPAASAEEALDRMADESPDILMTDIRMTGLTGLELAEQAKQMLPEIEVIILSGYDDFQYTQNAIRQHVSDYLLKTSKPEEIIKTVLKVKQRLQVKWAAESHARFKSRRAQQQSFENWLTRGAGAGESPDLTSEYLAPLVSLRAAPLHILMLSAEGWSNPEQNRGLMLFAVQNAVDDLMTCLSFLEKDRVVVVTSAVRSEMDKQRQNVVFLKIESVLKCKLSVARGRLVHTVEALPESYATAKMAFEYIRLQYRNEWNYDEIAGRKGGKNVCHYEEEKRLCAILLDGNLLALRRWVQQYVNELISDPEVTPQSLESAFQSAALAANRWLDRAVSSNRPDSFSVALLAPFSYSAETAPYEQLFQYVHMVMKLYHDQIVGNQKSHIIKAIAFIEGNLRHNLSLQQIAQHVHLHPGHLSVIFKKETGMTYRDFMLKIKMRSAMEMLLTSPVKIAEVAYEVGYEDVKYFGQIFKKYTGKTPSEFREHSMAAASDGEGS